MALTHSHAVNSPSQAYANGRKLQLANVATIAFPIQNSK
jgi:hypothetical protein